MNAAVLTGGAPVTTPQPQRAEENPRDIDSGLICLVMLARFHSLAADPEQLRHELGESGEHFGVFEILLAAKKLGLVAKRVSPKP